jgi:hypothetical protein
MRLSPILPVSLAVAAVALSASQGNTVVEPDKRSNQGVVAFPLFALKASDRILSSNNHYSHESHSSHVSGGHSSHESHSSHLSSIPSSPAPAPVPTTTAPAPVPTTTAPAQIVGSPTATLSQSGIVTAAPVPAGSGSGGPPSGAVPSGSLYSFSPQPTGNTSGGGDAAVGVLGVLVVTVGGVTYVVYRRNRRPK